MRVKMPGAANDQAAAALRDMIQQATSAYELAITTQARIATQAAKRHEQRLSDLAAQQAADASQREEHLRDQKAAAQAEAARAHMLSALADDLHKSAASLLERAALAHVFGFGPVSTDVTPHLATGEQAAAAFSAAQVAAVDLRAALLRLAQEYLRGGDWLQAREVATPLTAESVGSLATEATAVLRAASLGAC